MEKQLFVSVIYLDNINSKTKEQVKRQVRIRVKKSLLEEYKHIFTLSRIEHISKYVASRFMKETNYNVTKIYNNISFYLFINNNEVKLSNKYILDNFEDDSAKINLNLKYGRSKFNHRCKFKI